MSEEFLGGDQPSVTAEGGSPAPKQPSEGGKEPGKSDYSEFLEAITNSEGKPKYKSVPDALLGAAKAQEHIARLEAENAEMRSLKTKVDTMEQLIARLGEGKPADQPAVPKIEDQEKLVLSIMEKRELSAREANNRKAVLESLTSKFGDKTQEALKAKADDLGLSVSELGALAARSPKAVLSYFDVKAAGTPTVKGTVNTEALTPREDQSKTPENIMWGAPTGAVTEFFRQIKREVNKELGLP
jgi:hypothetical protein